MVSDKQRLEALEKYVSAQASNTTGSVAAALLWYEMTKRPLE